MSDPESRSSEWGRIISEWRPIWDEWNKVMDRLTLAFMASGVPSQDDLDQEQELKKNLDEIQERMEECRARIRQRFGS